MSSPERNFSHRIPVTSNQITYNWNECLHRKETFHTEYRSLVIIYLGQLDRFFVSSIIEMSERNFSHWIPVTSSQITYNWNECLHRKETFHTEIPVTSSQITYNWNECLHRKETFHTEYRSLVIKLPIIEMSVFTRKKLFTSTEYRSLVIKLPIIEMSVFTGKKLFTPNTGH